MNFCEGYSDDKDIVTARSQVYRNNKLAYKGFFSLYYELEKILREIIDKNKQIEKRTLSDQMGGFSRPVSRRAYDLAELHCRSLLGHLSISQI